MAKKALSEKINAPNANIEELEKAKVKEELAVASAAVGEVGGLAGLEKQAGEVAYGSYAKKGFRYACYKVVKRAFDIVASGLAMILLSPVILITLFAKWVEDWAAPVYTSERVGQNKKDGSRGDTFKFHKIRSMCPHAEEMKDELIEKGLNEADGPAFKMKEDPRITKVGKFIRTFSIDELPQLWDIFVGRMSVVGPRSPLPQEVDKYTPYQMHRLDVKGGLLCLWQIQKNRNSLSFDEWVALDIEYIQKQSIWLDLKIIFKGAWMVLFDRSGE